MNIKVIINYMIHWINIYSKELFEKFDYMSINPKVVVLWRYFKSRSFLFDIIINLRL